MIKITFEFPTVDSAVAFLQKRKLPLTNETVGVIPSIAGLGSPEATAAIEAALLGEDKPLSARERRLARKNKGDKKPGYPRKHGPKKSSEPQDTPKTKSRSKKAEPVSDEITDVDLAKAASLGAEEITPMKVTAILKQFGAEHVSDLESDKRKEFLDLLDKEIEAEK